MVSIFSSFSSYSDFYSTVLAELEPTTIIYRWFSDSSIFFIAFAFDLHYSAKGTSFMFNKKNILADTPSIAKVYDIMAYSKGGLAINSNIINPRPRVRKFATKLKVFRRLLSLSYYFDENYSSFS